MDFIDTVEIIKAKYRDAGQEELATEVNRCLMQGGTLGERFLIFADWLKELRGTNFDKYKIAYEEGELIIEGAKKYFIN